MPFVDVLVPDDPHAGDALSRKCLGRRHDRRIVPRVPGREQSDLSGFRKAGELGYLAQGRRRRLFEQDVKPFRDAFASDLVADRGRRGDRNGFESFDLVEQLAPVGIDRLDALAGAARRRDQLQPLVRLDRRDVLVGGDLAVADDGDADRPHQRFTAATKARAFSNVSPGSCPGL